MTPENLGSVPSNSPASERELGATAVEYGLLMAFVAAIIFATVETLGQQVVGLYSLLLLKF